jgi:uncharacterized membrane protein
MDILMIISIILFVISIIAFFIKNGFERQSLIQIFATGYNPTNLRFLLFSNPPDGLLVLSVIAFIIFIINHRLIKNLALIFIIGLLIIFIQKILILVIQRIRKR